MTATGKMDRHATRSRLRAAIELGLFLAVLLVPLAGVWAASSLAAYWNGSRGLALAIGALVFPVLPLAWEGVAEFRRRARDRGGKRVLTFVDRMTLRTLALSLAFLVPMTLAWPLPLFQALTTRGDWFLEDVDAAWATQARRALLATADGLGWLYDHAHDNPWRGEGAREKSGSGTGSAPRMQEVHVAAPTATPSGSAAEPLAAELPAAEPPAAEPLAAEPPSEDPPSSDAPRNRWPFPNELHPLALAPPATAEASISALGDYYASAIADPTERAKAVHDWIAHHVAYDAVSYARGIYPPQTAEGTFEQRLSVCAGYAYLFTALGRAAGLTVETVVGDARTGSGEPEGHAWNAIELDGAWQLVDTTWDAGSVSGTEFTRRYRSSHFLVPPEVIGVTHLPDDARWQLREPITRGEWNRQPILEPEFFARGLRLVAPDRAQVDAESSVSARVESRGGQFLLATIEAKGGGVGTKCAVSGERNFDVQCALPHPGRFTVRLYSSAVQFGTYQGIASFEAVSR